MAKQVWLSLILVSALALGAPVPPNRAVSLYTEAQAKGFSEYIDEAITKLTVERYGAPLDTELWRAALLELYETTSKNKALLMPNFEKMVLDRNRKPGDYKTYFTKERLSIGDHPNLSDGQDLIRCLRRIVKTVDKTSELGGIDLTYSRTGIRVPRYTTPPYKIQNIIIGSPAQLVGLRPDDEIVEINGVPLANASSAVLWANLHDEKREDFTVKVSRIGDRTKEYKFKVTPYTPEQVLGVERKGDYQWNYFVDPTNKIAHVRLQSIEVGVVEELSSVLDHLQRKEGMKGMILDLRPIKYGDFESALTICELFVKQGTLIKSKRKNGETFAVDPTDHTPEKGFDKAFFDLPLIVLVNQETSGAGEVIAAALQGNKRARVYGRRTAGGGTIKEPLIINESKGIIATAPSGEFLHPNGDKVVRNADEFSELKSKWGVDPIADYWCPTSLDLSQEVTKQWYLLSLRPAASNEAFKTNDPAYDVVRNLALKALLKEMGIKPKK